MMKNYKLFRRTLLLRLTVTAVTKYLPLVSPRIISVSKACLRNPFFFVMFSLPFAVSHQMIRGLPNWTSKFYFLKCLLNFSDPLLRLRIEVVTRGRISTNKENILLASKMVLNKAILDPIYIANYRLENGCQVCF